MGMVRTVSLIQIIIGAAVMLLSMVIGLEIRRNASGYLRTKWLVIIVFTAFFFLGYNAIIIFQLLDLSFPLEFLIGTLFLAGFFFVYLVMRITSMTLRSINEKEKELLAAHPGRHVVTCVSVCLGL